MRRWQAAACTPFSFRKRFRQREPPEVHRCLRLTVISAVLLASMSAQFSRIAFAIRNSFKRPWTGCRRRFRRPRRRRSKIQSCGGQIVARGNTRPTVRIAIGDCLRRVANNSQLVSFRGGRSWNAQSLLKTARTPTPGWRMMELLDSGSLSLFGGHELQAHWRRHMECLAGGS
jgi:hypothetical protein